MKTVNVKYASKKNMNNIGKYVNALHICVVVKDFMTTTIPPSELKPGVRSASTSTHSPTDMKLMLSSCTYFVIDAVRNMGDCRTRLSGMCSRIFSATIFLNCTSRSLFLLTPFIPFAAPLLNTSTSAFRSASVMTRKDCPYCVVSLKVSMPTSTVYVCHILARVCITVFGIGLATFVLHILIFGC
jgi:hypothetical protein